MWRLGSSSSPAANKAKEESSPEEVHRKRVHQILRFISTMQVTNGNDQYSFVRPVGEHTQAFFQQNSQPQPNVHHHEDEEDDDLLEPATRVLFTMVDFQRLAADLKDGIMPFSFYATGNSATTNNTTNLTPRKRTWQGFQKSSHSPASATATNNNNNASPCWLRLTRMTAEDPPKVARAVVSTYLQAWSALRKERIKQLLTLEHLPQAPATANRHVVRFLKRYQLYLEKRQLQRRMEKIYNALFEWYTQQESGGDSDHDLIWGLGQARMRRADGIMIDGPLLEVKVEVELARDGALLVRPKQHAGVSVNRHVLAAITGTNDNNGNLARSLHQSVKELDTTDVCPGAPATYIPLLKRMAVELSSGGTFQRSIHNTATAKITNGKLVVTDAWCLYSSPRPTATWARDALAFVEKTSTTSVKKNKQTATNNTNNIHSELPNALWALTHGPGALERFCHDKQHTNAKTTSSTLWNKYTPSSPNTTTPPRRRRRPPFPLPTSDAQNHIAELLLEQQYPAVVCEGPPGTGKTHTIANIVCAYLCQGKRVLVTSKGAPALSVLRERLPQCVQELCVDVSMSESAGMRQLQQTVERLANKVSWVNTERETHRSEALEQDIQELEDELVNVDRQLSENAEQKRTLIQTHKGQQLVEKSLDLIETVPWLMDTIAKWDTYKLRDFSRQMSSLVVDPTDPSNLVNGYPMPPSDALISLVSSNAGSLFSYIKNSSNQAMASIPVIGSRISEHRTAVQEQMDSIRIKTSKPQSKEDWRLVLKALELQKAIANFHRNRLQLLVSRHDWPEHEFLVIEGGKQVIKPEMAKILETATVVKNISKELGVDDQVRTAIEMGHLDARRTSISWRIQQLAEELVSCRVVAELSRNFSAEAQSALVKFAQVSGKARFGKAAQASKMTQRQRRKRQEYLEAFEKCVRYIPCWILTSTQISDYLPAECLFDLVVIDEASQSDPTVLPGMLRGKQWLIVGDGKQVSPTESFVSEDQIEMLKAALPESPFEDSMLPGHSFFDLCSQAFPKGRVILREHFRCAPEIITYSNTEFYNGNLVPLRLPTSAERLTPSLVDIRVRGGKKVGKVNEAECDEIVRQIREYVEACTLAKKRTIGVISLVGDEQSRLIRGRLLDSIGPHKYKLHDILVGEPPSFQGAERDIVFLSMVCSPGAVVTQGQLMHAQRGNVALSRARDRMVLVRSIDINHIPNQQDIKFSILDFFERASFECDSPNTQGVEGSRPSLSSLAIFRTRAEALLTNLLQDRGFVTRSMGVVWDNALCVEDSADGNSRAAITIEATGESREEWKSMLVQQKSIERVGWKCLRVDALSFLTDHTKVLESIHEFLANGGVHPVKTTVEDQSILDDEIDSTAGDEQAVVDLEVDIDAGGDNGEDAVEVPANLGNPEAVEALVMISSEEDNDKNISDGENSCNDRKPAAMIPDVVESNIDLDELGNGERASDYGNIADLGFLRVANHFQEQHGARAAKARRLEDEESIKDDEIFDDDNDIDVEEKQRIVTESTRETFQNDDLSESTEDELDPCLDTMSRASKGSKRRRTRLDKYSRDGRYYPKRSRHEDDDVPYEDFIEEVVPERSKKPPFNDAINNNKNETDDDEDENEMDDVEQNDSDSAYVEERP